MSIILDVECIACNKTLQKINHNPREVSLKMGKINNNRRCRIPNWSFEEKQFLLELIRERKEVVVTKSNNGPNHSEEKDVAWNDILYQLATKFGSKFSDFSLKKVKTQWQNMKRIAREEIILNGASLAKCSKQSQEVCNILETQNAADLKLLMENSNRSEKINETKIYTDVEIKSEVMDEDNNQPSCSSFCYTDNQQNAFALESSASSTSMPSEIIDADIQNEIRTTPENITKKDVSTATDLSSIDNFNDFYNLSNFHKAFGNFVSYSDKEKEIKMESLKEEQQIVRAMRETAELNKIIAEQRLKHVLWIKKHEMAMYSGEPGSGAGKGGGGGGAIREAGGAFGKMEAAREEEYFYKKQREQLLNIKGHLDKEIMFHQEQIKRHEDAIRRHKEQMAEMSEKGNTN